MSEELEALERLTDDVLDRKHYYKQFSSSEPVILQDKKLIQTALEDYETYKMYSSDEFKEFVYKNDFKSVKNIELAFNSLIKRNNNLKKENEKLKKQIAEKNKAKEKMLEIRNIEAELGIDLVTLFKALREKGIWIKNSANTIFHLEPIFIKVEIDCDKPLIASIVLKELYYEDLDGVMDTTGEEWFMDDYGKKWALSKEELEGKFHEKRIKRTDRTWTKIS